MYFHDKRLQIPVRVETPDPLFARQLGGMENVLPIPNSFDQSLEKREFSYVFAGTDRNGEPPPAGRFTQDPSLDGKGEFTSQQAQPLGEEGPARPGSGAQREQMDPSQTMS